MADLYENQEFAVSILTDKDAKNKETLPPPTRYMGLSGVDGRADEYSIANDIEMKQEDNDSKCETALPDSEEIPSSTSSLCKIWLAIIFLFVFVIILAVAVSILTFFAYSQINAMKLQVSDDKDKDIQILKDITMRLNHSTIINTEEIVKLNYSSVIYLINETLNEQLMFMRTAYYNTSLYIETIIQTLGGLYEAFPADSCNTINTFNPTFPSGFYWVRSGNAQSIQVYCDMRELSYSSTGWVRIAKLTKTSSGDAECFSGLQQSSFNRSSCVILSDSANCSHTYFSVLNISYSRVYGVVRAYGILTPDGFPLSSSLKDINDNYVDGISFTYGSSSDRQHIYTLVSSQHTSRCQERAPSFVSNNSACLETYDSEDPYCSGSGCTRNFSVSFEAVTNHNIEMRVCRDQARDDEDIVIEDLELYVQ